MDDLVVAYSKNLSKGGLFVRTDKFLPMDATVRLHLELPDGGGEITVLGRVAYIREDTDWGTVGQPCGMGIQFLTQDDDVQARVERFITDESAPEASDGESPRAPIDVVIVDDDRAFAEAAAEPFRARGDHVRLAHNGIEALALCIKHAPDVILSDVNMPKMDGWQLLRLVRARADLAQVPFLFLTTLSSEPDRLKGYRLGVDDYINKPYRPTEVVARADQAVRRAGRGIGGGSHQDEALRGDLEQVGLPSVLSFLEMEKQTGVLNVLERQAPNASIVRIFLDHGRPLRVEQQGGSAMANGPTAHRDALFRVLDVEKGRFEFVPQSVDGEDLVGVSSTALLLEHARRRDEQVR
jgi:uncharacterized protein (TIGR02266 family)